MKTPRWRIGTICVWLLAGACSDRTSLTTPVRPSLAENVAALDTPLELVSGVGANMCADVWGASTEPGTAVASYPCHGGGNQRFTMTAKGEVTAYDGSLCLDAWGATGRDGDKVVVWPCHGGANQQWVLTPTGTITGINGKCLDVSGATDAPGAVLIVWTCHGGANQRWTARGAGTAPAPVAPTPAPGVPGTWTFCTNAGAPCDFVGLRDVRLGAAAGPYVQQTAYGSVPCAAYGFAGKDPAPGQPLHCDYGPLKTTTLANPMPGMAGLGGTVTVALGAPGTSDPQIGPAWDQPTSTPGTGSFRTTCSMARFAFDDPIVYPGQPGASHLHVFFGNTDASATSTPETIAGSGNSTCRGGTLNRTAYWAPALFDARTGEAQPPLDGVFYYKTGYGIDPRVVQPFPAGLRMIAGRKTATSAQDHVDWGCRDRWIASTGAVPTTCPVGDAVRLSIEFPQCWDGVHLDAPDHQSHMAYPTYRNPPQVSTCPPTHPVTLPAITEHFDYPVTTAANPAAWRLSSDMYSTATPGGFSAHADWMNGWDPAIMRTIVTQCLNTAMDCGVGSIGDGRTLH